MDWAATVAAVDALSIARLLQAAQILPAAAGAAVMLAAGGDGAVAQLSDPGAAAGVIAIPGAFDHPFLAAAGLAGPVARAIGIR